jgi:FtsZ-binding cell division protein ZapB
MVERYQKKTELHKGYDDTVIRVEALEKELGKLRKHSTLLQSKLDNAFAQYHNEIQDIQAKRDDLIQKNKSLRQKNKGMLSTVVLEYCFCRFL